MKCLLKFSIGQILNQNSRLRCTVIVDGISLGFSVPRGSRPIRSSHVEQRLEGIRGRALYPTIEPATRESVYRCLVAVARGIRCPREPTAFRPVAQLRITRRVTRSNPYLLIALLSAGVCLAGAPYRLLSFRSSFYLYSAQRHFNTYARFSTLLVRIRRYPSSLPVAFYAWMH